MSVSSRKEKEIELQGEEGLQKFVLVQYDGFRGLAYQRKLAKILYPAIQELLSNPVDLGDGTVNLEIGAAIGKFMENIDQVEPAFIKELVVQGAYKAGRVSINFENDFAGNYDVLFLLVAELIKFNFSSLFTMLGSGKV